MALLFISPNPLWSQVEVPHTLERVKLQKQAGAPGYQLLELEIYE
jgi:hypothetical protein